MVSFLVPVLCFPALSLFSDAKLHNEDMVQENVASSPNPELVSEAFDAAEKDNLGTVKALLRSVPITVLGPCGRSLAHVAAWHKSESVLTFLLLAEPRLAGYSDSGGYTPLHTVARWPRLFLGLLQELVGAGNPVDLTLRNNRNETPGAIFQRKLERSAASTIYKKHQLDAFKELSAMTRQRQSLEWGSPAYWWQTIGYIEAPDGLALEQVSLATCESVLAVENDPETLLRVETHWSDLTRLVRHAPLPESEISSRRVTALASHAVSSDRHIPIPAGYCWYPYQLAGIAFLIDHEAALLADEMGLGKTAQLIGAVNALPEVRSIVVVCPAVAKSVWVTEWQRFSTRADLVPPVIVSGKEAKHLESATAFVVNYESLLRYSWLRERTWDLLVLDECHYAKNPDARRTKLALDLKARRRVAISGTPILSDPAEIFPVLRWLRPDLYATDIGGIPALRQLTERRQLGIFQQRLRETVMVRRLKSEVAADLPEKRRQIISLAAEIGSPLSAALQKEKQECARQEASLIPAESSYAISKLGSAETCRLALEALQEAFAESRDRVFEAKHQLALAKVDDVLAHVRLCADREHRIVVFAHHHDVMDRLLSGTKSHGLSCVRIDGQVPAAKRAGLVAKFQTGSADVAILGIHAGGQAITLNRADMVVFAELDWVPAIHLQAEDRAHRIGQREKLLCQYLVVEGSLEERICRRLESKMEAVGESIAADQNEDGSWLFPGSIVWHNALRGYGHGRLVEIGRSIPATEHSRLREVLAAAVRANAMENQIDCVLVARLLQIPEWNSQQAGAAKLLDDRCLRRASSPPAVSK